MVNFSQMARATPQKNILSLDNVNLTIQDQSILKEINFAIHEKEIVTIIGPNGAGKTSLLKVILGSYKPDSGHILKKENLKIGYVPQKINLSPTIPIQVERFLSLWHPTTTDEIKKNLALVKATHILDKPLHSLSGGELQRVLIARALLSKPDLLILDEPVQGVDSKGQREIYKLLNTLRDKKGLSILLVSHDLHFVMSSTDQVICLNNHICCQGHPETISKDPHFLSLFERDEDHLTLYHHHHDHDH